MAPAGKRRRVVSLLLLFLLSGTNSHKVEEELEAQSASDEVAGPSTQRRRRDIDSSSEDEPSDAVETDQDQLVKKLVRYALACEYSRQPIRRDDIRTKVFGKQKAKYNHVFESAQKELKRVFGMEMTELPLKEKFTLKDRIAAVKATTVQAASRAYILTSTLPSKYRDPAIIKPSNIPTNAAEATYAGLYTMIYSLIVLNGGKLLGTKLDRYLSRMNAEVNMGSEKTELILAKMIRQGYLVKVKDNVGGDEVVEWVVGPRGKLEVGNAGVEGLVLEAYGESAPDDLSDRIETSLGLKTAEREKERERDTHVQGTGGPSGRGRGRPRRAHVEDDD